MRVSVEVDEALIVDALLASGLPTREAAVEEALGRLVRAERQKQAIEAMRGMGWEGDLDEIRRTRDGVGEPYPD